MGFLFFTGEKSKFSSKVWHIAFNSWLFCAIIIVKGGSASILLRTKSYYMRKEMGIGIDDRQMRRFTVQNKTSFHQYVQNKLYDAIFRGVDAYVKENSDRLDLTSRRIYDIEEVYLEDIEIKHVNVEDKEGMRVDFFPIVNATVAFSGRGKYDVEEDSKDIYFRLHCTGDLSKHMEDFTIRSIEEFNSRRQMSHALSDGLVPYIKTERLEEYAERILEKYYPEALKGTNPVDANRLAHNMGLEVHRATLTEDGSIFGQIYFSRSKAEIIDSKTGIKKKGWVNPNTVIIDTNALYMRSIRGENITLSHECVHFALHRKAFLLEQLLDDKLTKIQCQVTGDMVGVPRDSETSWMEWQANAIAPLLIMPKKAFKKKAEEIIAELRAENDGAEIIDIIEEVIDRLASHFDVTRAAAKARLVDVGIDEARGAYIYIDGRYVKPHRTSERGLILKDKAFSVPSDYAGIAIMTDKRLNAAVLEGRYQYVDSHFVLNTPKYLQYDRNGHIELTRYARNHIEECCLVFDVDFEKTGSIWHEYRSFCVLNRDKESPYSLKYTFSGGLEHATPDRQKEYLDGVLADERRVFLEMPKTLPEALKYLKDWRKMTNAEIANRIGRSEKTVERIIKGDGKTSIETLVLICFGLHLPPLISMPLLELGNVKLSNSPRDLVLKQMLLVEYGSDMDTIFAHLAREKINL